MDLGKGSIGLLQNSMIMLMCVGLMNHVLVIPMLFDKAGRDAWISILLIGVPLFIWIPMIYYILKKIKHQHLLVWLKEKYSSWVAWALIVPFLIYLFLMGFITIRETTTWLVTSSLPQTPIFATGTAFMVLCFFAARSGIKGIAILSGILLPLVIVFGYFVSFSNMKFKDYGLLRPMFEHGLMPTFKGMIYAGSGIIEMSILLFLQRHLKSKYKVWHLWILGLLFMYLLFGPVTGALAEFGPFMASLQRYPAFEEWRLVKIGRHLEHVDFLVIYQWTSGAFIRIATVLFLFVDLINLKSQKAKTILLLLVTILMVAMNQIPLSDPNFLLLLSKYYFPLSLVVVFLCSLILFVLAIFSNKKRGSSP